MSNPFFENHSMLDFQNFYTYVAFTILVGLSWVALYQLNMIGYTPSQLPFISWIFIPSGFKLFITLILRLRSILGLFLGSMWLNIHYRPELFLHDQIILSLISAFTGYLACIIIENRFNTQLLATKLPPKMIMVLSVGYAFTNTIIHTVFFNLHHELMSIRFVDPIKMFIGDLLGVIIFMLGLKYGMQILRKLNKK